MIKHYSFCALLFFYFGLVVKAQTKLSINNATVSISPSYTVNNATPISVTGQVKNVGTTTITANVHVNMAIDTSSTGTPKYFKRSTATIPVSNFTPNSILNFTVTDNADHSNGYKIAGNGTTVVIWSVVGLSTDSTTALDSLFTTVYVVDLTGIDDENNFEEKSIIVQNPTNTVLSFEFLDFNKEPVIIELINTNGECVLTELITTKNSTLKTNNLLNGLYYLNFTNNRTQKTITKKIIIQQ